MAVKLLTDVLAPRLPDFILAASVGIGSGTIQSACLGREGLYDAVTFEIGSHAISKRPSLVANIGSMVTEMPTPGQRSLDVMCFVRKKNVVFQCCQPLTVNVQDANGLCSEVLRLLLVFGPTC